MHTEQEYAEEYTNDDFDMEEYVKGFNDSYLLAAHEPSLLADIIPGLNPTNDFFSGFFAGKAQWEREQEKAQVNELAQIRDHSRDKEKGLERGV